MAEREIMTVEEVAAYLRVHQSTIYRYLKRKQIPAFKMGSDWRFHKSALDEWARARTLGGRVDVYAPPGQVIMGVVRKSERG